MTRVYLVLAIVVVLVAVVTLGVVATQIGGSSIRSASRTHTLGTLTAANNTLLPGVPATIRIGGEVGIQTPAVVQLRLTEVTRTIRGVSPQEMAARAFVIVVPCDMSTSEEGDSGRLVLVNSESGAVLAQSSQARLLPPGPDCVR
jgi:hypothetical protein